VTLAKLSLQWLGVLLVLTEHVALLFQTFQCSRELPSSVAKSPTTCSCVYQFNYDQSELKSLFKLSEHSNQTHKTCAKALKYSNLTNGLGFLIVMLMHQYRHIRYWYNISALNSNISVFFCWCYRYCITKFLQWSNYQFVNLEVK
jgi:hypothetical protein